MTLVLKNEVMRWEEKRDYNEYQLARSWSTSRRQHPLISAVSAYFWEYRDKEFLVCKIVSPTRICGATLRIDDKENVHPTISHGFALCNISRRCLFNGNTIVGQYQFMVIEEWVRCESEVEKKKRFWVVCVGMDRQLLHCASS